MVLVDPVTSPGADLGEVRALVDLAGRAWALLVVGAARKRVNQSVTVGGGLTRWSRRDVAGGAVQFVERLSAARRLVFLLA